MNSRRRYEMDMEVDVVKFITPLKLHVRNSKKLPRLTRFVTSSPRTDEVYRELTQDQVKVLDKYNKSKSLIL